MRIREDRPELGAGDASEGRPLGGQGRGFFLAAPTGAVLSPCPLHLPRAPTTWSLTQGTEMAVRGEPHTPKPCPVGISKCLLLRVWGVLTARVPPTETGPGR